MARFTRLWDSTRRCSVPCLLSIIELQQICEKSSVRLSEETKQHLLYQMIQKLGPSQSQKLISKFIDDEVLEWKVDYEVESILDHCKDEHDSQIYYLIKWVGWGHEHNTWEPEQNLHCEELLQEYRQLVMTGPCRKRKPPNQKQEDQNGLKKRRIDELFQKLVESKILDTLSPLDMIKCYSPNKKKAHTNGLPTQLQPKLLRKKKIPQKLLRQEVKRALKIWQDELNNIIRGYDPAPVMVENNVDLEGPPENFIYINERKEGPGVIISKDPLIGCDCEDCYLDRKTCCFVASGSELAYYKSTGRLRVPKGMPIYECNIRCKCGPDCLNRVVQKGRRVKICIFRTPNGRGWGVKTLQKVKKGTFVMEYVGEVITNEEAERRGKEYDAVGRTYLFDLDFHDADAPFTVDAGTHGNAAHFINHSCNPNLEVYVVWINTIDPQLPHICLYAKRDIDSHEELTFDYMSGNPMHESTPLCENQDSNLPHQTETVINDENQDSNLPHQTETVINDDILGAHSVKAIETNSLEAATLGQPEMPGDDKKQETQSLENFWDKESTEPHSRDTEQLDSFVPDKWSNIPTPSSDAESIAERTGNNETSKFSMACLCGASNCRKFLFF